MAKERGVCKHYLAEGQCALNKEATFWKHCQICPSWKKCAQTKTPRPDTRKSKKEKISKRELREY